MVRRKNHPKSVQCVQCEVWFAPQGIGVHQAKVGHVGRVFITPAEARARAREEQALEYENARALVVGYVPPEQVEAGGGGLTVPLAAPSAVTPPVERARVRVVDPSRISLRIIPGVVVEDEEGHRYLLTEFDNA